MTLFHDRRYGAVALTLVAIKLWLTAAQPLAATAAAFASGADPLDIAAQLMAGKGFGLDGFTGLSSGPLLPVWIAITYLAGIPAPLANQLLYLCGCYAVVRALRTLVQRDGVRLALFAVLVWNPMTFHAPGLAQVGPWPLVAAQTLLLMAGLAGVLSRQDSSRRTHITWGGLAGVSLAALILTAGPTVWSAVAAVTSLITLAVDAARRPDRRRRAVLSGGALLTAAGIVLGAYCHFSYWNYGNHGVGAMRTWDAAPASAPAPDEVEGSFFATTAAHVPSAFDAVATFKSFSAFPRPSTEPPAAQRRLSLFMQWPVLPAVGDPMPVYAAGHWRIDALNAIGKGLRLLNAILIYGGLLAWLVCTIRRRTESLLWRLSSLVLIALLTMLVEDGFAWAGAATSTLPQRLAGAYPLALLFAGLSLLDAGRSARGEPDADPNSGPGQPGRAPAPASPDPLRPLFPQTPWQRALVFGFVAIAIVSIRKTDALYNPQFWAEDGVIFFSQDAEFGPAAIFKTYSGYLHLVPRLIAWVGGHLSACHVPAFYVGSALVCFGLTTARLFSPRLTLPNKPLLALALALVPHQGEVFATPTNIQWFAALLFPMILLSEDARTRAQRARDLVIAGVAGLTGPFSILVAPLFVVRWWRRRSRESLLLLAVVGGCAAIQAVLILAIPTPPIPRTGPVELLNLLAVASRRLPMLLVFGQAGSPIFTTPFIIVTGAVLLVLLGWITHHSRASRWSVITMWVLAAVVLAASTYKDRIDLYPREFISGDRYFFMPRVLMLWLLACSATWRTWPGRAAGAVLVLSFAANLPHLLAPHYADHHWEDYCARIDAGERIVVPINPGVSFLYPGSPAIESP